MSFKPKTQRKHVVSESAADAAADITFFDLPLDAYYRHHKLLPPWIPWWLPTKAVFAFNFLGSFTYMTLIVLSANHVFNGDATTYSVWQEYLNVGSFTPLARIIWNWALITWWMVDLGLNVAYLGSGRRLPQSYQCNSFALWMVYGLMAASEVTWVQVNLVAPFACTVTATGLLVGVYWYRPLHSLYYRHVTSNEVHEKQQTREANQSLTVEAFVKEFPPDRKYKYGYVDQFVSVGFVSFLLAYQIHRLLENTEAWYMWNSNPENQGLGFEGVTTGPAFTFEAIVLFFVFFIHGLVAADAIFTFLMSLVFWCLNYAQDGSYTAVAALSYSAAILLTFMSFIALARRLLSLTKLNNAGLLEFCMVNAEFEDA